MDPFTADIIATSRREALSREAENERAVRSVRRRDRAPTTEPRPRPATRPATA